MRRLILTQTHRSWFNTHTFFMYIEACTQVNFLPSWHIFSSQADTHIQTRNKPWLWLGVQGSPLLLLSASCRLIQQPSSRYHDIQTPHTLCCKSSLRSQRFKRPVRMIYIYCLILLWYTVCIAAQAFHHDEETTKDAERNHTVLLANAPVYTIWLVPLTHRACCTTTRPQYAVTLPSIQSFRWRNIRWRRRWGRCSAQWSPTVWLHSGKYWSLLFIWLVECLVG